MAYREIPAMGGGGEMRRNYYLRVRLRKGIEKLQWRGASKFIQ